MFKLQLSYEYLNDNKINLFLKVIINYTYYI